MQIDNNKTYIGDLVKFLTMRTNNIEVIDNVNSVVIKYKTDYTDFIYHITYNINNAVMYIKTDPFRGTKKTLKCRENHAYYQYVKEWLLEYKLTL